jgi:hypothetical protein
MMRAALALAVLVACSTSNKDFPTRPPGNLSGNPNGSPGPGGGGVDGGTGNPIGDGGLVINGRVCVVHDLRNPTDCDDKVDISHVKVLLGNRTTTATISKLGEFAINAGFGSDLVWRATLVNYITTVMPFGIDATIPIVPEALYQELLDMNSSSPNVTQGSVLVRVLNDSVPAIGVTATTNLVNQGIINAPLYDQDNSATDWNTVGGTQKAGLIWIPVADATTTPRQVNLTAMGSTTPVTLDVEVEALSLTFVTHDLK